MIEKLWGKKKVLVNLPFNKRREDGNKNMWS